LLNPTETPPNAREITDLVVAAIRDARFNDGDAMPSTRALAQHLRVSRSTVVRAYETLAGMGILTSAQGKATQVSEGACRILSTAGAAAPDRHREPHQKPKLDLRLHQNQDSVITDDRAWKSAWRAAVNKPPTASGLEQLNAALARHLRSLRGLSLRDDDSLIIRPSLAALTDDLLFSYPLQGCDVAVEDPGNPKLHRILVQAGARIQPVPLDEEGIRVDLLGPKVKMVFVTPARQYPTGVVMSPQRRTTLLNWAVTTGTIVVETDLDVGPQPGAAPTPALASQTDQASICYIGMAHRLLPAGVELLWMVPPPGFRRRSHDAAPVNDYVATAVAQYFNSGALYRQRNRTVAMWHERKSALLKYLAAVSGIRVIPHIAGSQVAIQLTNGADELDVQVYLEDRGFRVSVLGEFSSHSQKHVLLIDCAELPPAHAGKVARALADALR
jgi:GntR family transcriptional regulator/MocR family aminotransferase